MHMGHLLGHEKRCIRMYVHVCFLMVGLIIGYNLFCSRDLCKPRLLQREFHTCWKHCFIISSQQLSATFYDITDLSSKPLTMIIHLHFS